MRVAPTHADSAKKISSIRLLTEPRHSMNPYDFFAVIRDPSDQGNPQLAHTRISLGTTPSY